MLKETLIFVAGIGIGCAASVSYLKPKYDERLNREIEDLDRVYRNKYNKKTPDEDTQECTENEEEEKPIKKSEVEKAEEIIQKNDYTVYSKQDDGPDEKEPEIIRIISGDQYDYDHEYEKNSLIWHLDNVLVDDIQGIKIDDADNIVGTNFVKEFDDPDVDVVYVRNEKIKIDFEIARDLRSYAEMVEKGFYQG